jgi:hypothetical protein
MIFFQDNRLFPILIRILRRSKCGSVSHVLSLACLQRMSLRPSSQREMIKSGIIALIVFGFFKDSSQLSDFTAEFSSALFMNIANCEEATADFENSTGSGSLSIISEFLMTTENDQVKQNFIIILVKVFEYLSTALLTILRKSSHSRNAAINNNLDILWK